MRTTMMMMQRKIMRWPRKTGRTSWMNSRKEKKRVRRRNSKENLKAS